MSNQYTKIPYSKEEIDNIIKDYQNGIPLSKLRVIYKRKKENIKSLLIENNIFIEGRDKLKKDFNKEIIEEILNYYQKGVGSEKISKIYGVSKVPILRILKENNVLQKGYSNGKKIILTEEQKEKIKDLYVDNYKNSEEISKIMNLNKSFIEQILSKSNYRRNRSQGTSIGLVKRFSGINYNEYINNLSEFKKYKRKVTSVTKKQPIHNLVNFEKRGISGIDGNYHLDHKFSIVEGFKQKISPWVIGNIINLEFIPWEENIKKRTKCSINEKELKSI
jgi:predicted transcriptional regulator